jgi:dihydrofolate synthase / folylpolyglutamate synthase
LTVGPADPVAFLFSLERLGMKFGLDNMRALCTALDHPEQAFQAVLVAGTNGKGSVTAMAAEALRAAGHRPARYTSPHLVRLEERFVIDGREVEPARLRASAARVRDAVESLIASGTLEGPPTFFECTTAVAFDLFRDAGVRLAILEVGLGGRLDATNVVSPVVSAITSIGMDHEAQLGSTLASIAREKAGVMRAGVPVVCGPLPAEAHAEVVAVAARLEAPLVEARAAVSLAITSDADRITVDVRTARRALPQVTLGLRGRHQADNAAVAVAILDLLDGQGHDVPDAGVRAGLEQPGWPGRLERFHHAGRDILLDAAHNPAGAQALADHLRRRGWTAVTLVFGAMADKDVTGMLEPLLPLCARLICAAPPSPRAMPAAGLAALAHRLAARPPRIDIEPDPVAALGAAVTGEHPVVVAGSIFLVGPLRDILR